MHKSGRLSTSLIVVALIALAVVFYMRHKEASKSAPAQKEAAAPNLTVSPAGQPADDAWRGEAQAALERGRAWLLPLQQENGAWSETNFPAMTALALWGLQGAAGEEVQAARDRAVAFIVSCVQPDGGIYVDQPLRKGGGLSTYNTAICMSALQQIGRADLAPVLQNARGFLARAQYKGDDKAHLGGFGYDAQHQRPYTDINNTYFALEAMRLTQRFEDLRPQGEAAVDINWPTAVAYVGSLQAKAEDGKDNEGGFIYNPVDPKAGAETNEAGRVVAMAYGTASFVGMTALLYGGVSPQDARIAAVLDFLARHWSLTENPRMNAQGLYFYYNIMARALSLAGVETIAAGSGGAPVQWRQALARQLVALQRGDGNWVNENGRFAENDPVLTTSYVLVAMQQILAGK